MIDDWVYICCILISVAEGTREESAIVDSISERLGIKIGKRVYLPSYLHKAQAAGLVRYMTAGGKPHYLLTPKGRLALVKYKRTAALMVRVMQTMQTDVEKAASV